VVDPIGDHRDRRPAPSGPNAAGLDTVKPLLHRRTGPLVASALAEVACWAGRAATAADLPRGIRNGMGFPRGLPRGSAWMWGGLVFLVLHGPMGEDGTIQGLFN